ncbi:MAG: helicase-related protein, partial [Myxococcota bacterium]|nr:helicase-related protein [Myxococcota bacterium]
MNAALPIDTLRDAFGAKLSEGAVVVSAPTGSGKSTRVPVWCMQITGRPVLVVEPRRVACRALAQRVAQLEAAKLGVEVGYSVRDDHRARPETQILFATPGVVLRMLADDPELTGFGTVVLDEFHERTLDVDLLMALLSERQGGSLVVMSATLQGDAIASHLKGHHLEGEGRTYPVEIRYLGKLRETPSERDLAQRIRAAVNASRGDPGDVLVFLPGKAEIAAAAQLLGDQDQVVTLHGGLSIDEQSSAFASSRRRKVILSTNVAETSITVPGVGVVIDSGLVRRTRYHQGRGFLTLAPIARDSAEQRSGRAGRTAPGVCYRLWSEGGQLDVSTPPEIHRDSLVPLVLAAAAAGHTMEALRFLDPPKEYALDSAREELGLLGILDGDGALTPRGRSVFFLPLDAALGRLLVEGEHRGTLEDMIDLVSTLSVGRRLFRGAASSDDGDEGLRASGCDVTAAVLAVRRGQAQRDGLDVFTLGEARRIRRRLRGAWDLDPGGDKDRSVNRQGMVATILAADPRAAHVARRRKRTLAWSNGGTELELARESAVRTEGRDAAEAVLVLDTIALGQGARETRLLATCAMPVTLRELERAGLGRDRLGGLKMKDGLPVSTLERV